MFEVPRAKRLKRSELFDNNSNESIERTNQKDNAETSTEAGADEQTIPDYGFEYDFIKPDTSSTEIIQIQDLKSEPEAEAEAPDQAFHFNLFAPPSKPQQTTTTATTDTQSTPPTPQTSQPTKPTLISIRSPSPTPSPLNNNPEPQIPASYYFTSALPTTTIAHLQQSYATTAISASTVLSLSRTAWPGTHHPWRVITLPAHRGQLVIHNTGSILPQPTPTPSNLTNQPSPHHNNNDDSRTSRTRTNRPSKTKRQALKARAQHRRALIDETRTKEEHEREKKNKKNRERKVKRRAKERREKEGRRGEDGGGDVGIEDGNGDEDGGSD